MIKPSLNAAALSGAIATFPMSAVLFMSNKLLSKKHVELPSYMVTKASLQKENADYKATEKNEVFEPLISGGRYAYGMAAATMYPVFRSIIPKRFSGWKTGASYGLLIWLGSQRGWIPSTHALQEPEKHKTSEEVTKFVSHVVWGAALGLCFAMLKNAETKRSKPISIDKNITLH